MVGESKNIDQIIKNLSCMRGIDEEFIPKFKFFKINKSQVRGAGEADKTMICFVDIS